MAAVAIDFEPETEPQSVETVIDFEPEEPGSQIPATVAEIEFEPEKPADRYIPETFTPAEEKAAAEEFAKEHPILENAAGAIIDTARGIPGFVAKLPGYAYQGAKFAAGGPKERGEVIGELLEESLPAGVAMRQGLEAPVGSREWFGAAIQAVMLATPGLEIVKGLKGAEVKTFSEGPIDFKAEPEVIRGGEIPSAESIRTQTQAPGIEAQELEPSAQGPIRVRGTPENRVATEQPTPTEPVETGIEQATVQTPGIAFRDDPGIPFMTKVRMEDDLIRAGFDEATIAQMPAAQVSQNLSRQILARQPVAIEPGAAEAAGFRSAETPRLSEAATMTAEERARLEYEQEQIEALQTAGAEAGPELEEAIIALGGLPGKGGAAREPWRGELSQIQERAKQARAPVNKVFRTEARDVDRLVTGLRDYGFDIETPQDLFPILEQRYMTGRKIYGNPARTAALSGMEEPGVFGFGPGAASAGEKLASYELRKFGKRFVEDKRIAEEIRENTGNRYYEPISNSITADEAVKLVDERPLSQVLNAVRDDQSGLPFHVRSTMGQLAIQRLNKAYENLTKSGATKEAETVLNQAVDLAEWQQDFGTRLGQGVQSFAMWQRLSPEGKLAGIKRQVQKTRDRYTADHVQELQEIIRVLKQERITDAERLAALKKLFSTNKTARKIKPNTQKLIDAARTGKFTDQIFYDIASERLGLPKYDQQIAAEIMRRAFKIDKAADGLPKDQATMELHKFIAEKMGFRASDLPVGVYYGNMLSGYNTQLVNTLDTFFNVISELNGLAMTNPRAAMKIYGNALKGFNEGRADFLMALTKGRQLTDSKWLEVPRLMEVARFGEKGGVPIKGDKLGGRIIKAVAESRPGKILNAWKYVSRLMAASDSIMFRGAKEGRAALLADRLARQQGLRGRALDRRVRELLGRTPEQTSAMREQARAEGFRGAAGGARVSEIREQMRSLEANADANEFAGIATYNHDPQGMLGDFSERVGKTSNRYPLLKLVVPFTRIVANVTNRGLNYTPWGFKRALYGYSGDMGLPKGDARAAMLARATMGTVGLTTLLGLQASGALEINGAGPSDPERRKQLQEAGWKPYSLRIGDKYWSYIYTPVGLGLAILGNMADSYRYREMDQKGALMRATYALSRIGSTIFSQSFLSGLQNLFSGLSSDPGQSIASWRRMFSQTAGTATTPRIIMDVQRVFDPTRYDSTTLAGDLLKNTPFAAVVNKPTLNAFGEPVKMPTNRFISEVKKDVAWQIVIGRGLRVPVPDKYTEMPDGRGGKRQITPEEYYEYLQKTGPKIKAYVLLQALTMSRLDAEEAQKRLSEKAQEIREPVLRRMRTHARYNPVD